MCAARSLRWERDIQRARDAYGRGNLDQAEAACQSALLQAERFSRQDPRLSASLDFLTTIERHRGRHDRARSWALRALAVKEEIHGAAHPGLASTLADLAEICAAAGEPDKAREYRQRALRLLERAIGDDLEELLASLRRSGLVDKPG